MHQGWIKLYRCLLDDPLWQCGTPEQRVILVTLLLMANHTEKKWQWQGRPFVCQPGQMITSLKSIQQKCGKQISISQIRRAIKRFETMGFLVNISAKDHRMITVCNWERYQHTSEAADIAPVKNVSGLCKDNVIMATPNKNVKNEKNVKKGRPSSFPLSFEQQDIQCAAEANEKAMAAFMEQ